MGAPPTEEQTYALNQANLALIAANDEAFLNAPYSRGLASQGLVYNQQVVTDGNTPVNPRWFNKAINGASVSTDQGNIGCQLSVGYIATKARSYADFANNAATVANNAATAVLNTPNGYNCEAAELASAAAYGAVNTANRYYFSFW